MEHRYNQANLDTEGVRDILDRALDPDGVLVEEDHPIVELIRHNAMLSQLDVDKGRRWIRVERVLVRACCAALLDAGFGSDGPVVTPAGPIEPASV